MKCRSSVCVVAYEEGSINSAIAEVGRFYEHALFFLSFSVVWCHSTWLSRISGPFLCSRNSFPVHSRPVVNPIALIHLFVGSGSE